MTHSLTASEDFGVHISLKVPERQPSGDWVGFYRSAGGGGICESSPRVSNVHLAGRDFDMDLHTGYKRGPGTAGAHPVCKGEGEHSASFLRQSRRECDLSRQSSCISTTPTQCDSPK